MWQQQPDKTGWWWYREGISADPDILWVEVESNVRLVYEIGTASGRDLDNRLSEYGGQWQQVAPAVDS